MSDGAGAEICRTVTERVEAVTGENTVTDCTILPGPSVDTVETRFARRAIPETVATFYAVISFLDTVPQSDREEAGEALTSQPVVVELSGTTLISIGANNPGQDDECGSSGKDSGKKSKRKSKCKKRPRPKDSAKTASAKSKKGKSEKTPQTPKTKSSANTKKTKSKDGKGTKKRKSRSKEKLSANFAHVDTPTGSSKNDVAVAAGIMAAILGLILVGMIAKYRKRADQFWSFDLYTLPSSVGDHESTTDEENLSDIESIHSSVV